MAADTLAGLIASIGDWTGRKLNASFSAVVPDFVAMAETRIFYGGDEPMQTPPLRILDMEKKRTIQIVAGVGKLPVGFLEFKRVNWDGGESPKLSFVTARELSNEVRTGDTPQCFTVEGDKINVSPAVDGSVTAVFYARYDALAVPEDTNWVMQNAPAVYLQAALIPAWEWIGNGERQTMAMASYRSAVSALNRQHSKSRTSGETLKIRGNMW